MFNVNDIVAIGGVLVGVIGGSFGLMPYFNKKGINTGTILTGTEQTLTAVEPIIKVAETVPALKSEAVLVDWIEQKSKAGVKAAEQLYHSGSLKTNEEKFSAAQQTTYSALKEINVTPTDNQKKLIDDFIQEAVNDLGHAPVSEAEKNAQLQKVQQDLSAAQAENSQLKQTIVNIQNTVGSSKNTNVTANQ